MKKLVFLIIATFILLSFVACDHSESEGKNHNTTDNKQSDVNDNINNSDNNEQSNPLDDIKEKIDATKITDITEFSEGIAWVRCGELMSDERHTLYCINKKGEILFTIYTDRSIAMPTPFYNGLSVVEMVGDNGILTCICDKTGKLYTAEDFGASGFVLKNDRCDQAFMDGYIILERREESYTGTKIEMSIIDSDFNTLVPFSVELAETIDNTRLYYDGYFYRFGYAEIETILDLRTGTLLSDTTQMKVSKPLLSYRSKDGSIYNYLTGEVVSKVEEHEYISQISFEGDMGLATYSADNGTWFNIIDKNGTAKFEPIKADNRSSIRFDGEIILVVSGSTKVSLKTYDVNGNLLGELVAESTIHIGPSVFLNDGVIWVNNHETCMAYNTSLEKLF